MEFNAYQCAPSAVSIFKRNLLFITLYAISAHFTYAAESKFSGTWSVDMRTPEQKTRRAKCGEATFVLLQTGKKITGSHTMTTVDCGRINEGGQGTVNGRVVGNHALLSVTSGRNGAVVKGVATLTDKRLDWKITEEIKAGEPEGDSPLILKKGTLRRTDK
jgi:hypothetical protein